MKLREIALPIACAKRSPGRVKSGCNVVHCSFQHRLTCQLPHMVKPVALDARKTLKAVGAWQGRKHVVEMKAEES